MNEQPKYKCTAYRDMNSNTPPVLRVYYSEDEWNDIPITDAQFNMFYDN